MWGPCSTDGFAPGVTHAETRQSTKHESNEMSVRNVPLWFYDNSVSGNGISVEVCSWFCLVHISCVWTEYVIRLVMPQRLAGHQQFNIQQQHALPTLYLCVLYLSENKQRLVPLTA